MDDWIEEDLTLQAEASAEKTSRVLDQHVIREPIRILPGTLAHSLFGATESVESFRCGYGVAYGEPENCGRDIGLPRSSMSLDGTSSRNREGIAASGMSDPYRRRYRARVRMSVSMARVMPT